MNDTTASIRTTRIVAHFVLVACSTAALGSIPPSILPWQWLAALLVPGLGLGMRSAHGGLDWPRLLVYLPAQAACAWFAMTVTGPLDLPAVLTAMLLPPLAFAIGRRGGPDALLATFLGFCLLLVGTILGGARPALTILFALGAAMQLRCQARLQLLGSVPDAAHTTAPLRATLGGLATAGATTVLAMALLQAFELVPAFARPIDPVQSRRERQVGLNDRFDLGGGGGFGDLRRVELVRVTNADPGALPEDLYLRTTFFDVPGAGSWSTSTFEPEPRDTVGRMLSVRPRVAQVPTLRTTIERRDAARAYVFAPAGTLSIRGLRALRADLVREWFRQAPDAPALVYEVQSQDLRWVLGDMEADERWAPALTRLPEGLDMQLFGMLLQEWAPQAGSAEETARAIAAGLRRRCSYSLEEPSGPYRQPLHDFLSGNRRGWCMHFASAAALMLRMKGIPCRIAVGLYGGDAEESRPEVRAYGSQHAHAWVEIPFRGLGWVVFDPTPPDHRGRRGVDEAAETASGDSTAPDLPAASSLLLPDAPWLPVVLVAGLLAVLFVPGSLHPRRGSASERAMRPVRKELVRLMAELARRGHPRSTRVTLEDYAAWLLARGVADPDLHAALRTYQDVRFGGREFDANRRSVFVRAHEAARRLPVADAVSG